MLRLELVHVYSEDKIQARQAWHLSPRQDRKVSVESEKWRKYDVLANKLGLEYKCATKIIPYVNAEFRKRLFRFL